MDEPKYLIINPLQIELNFFEEKKKNLSYIDKKFYEKMNQLKNISLETKRIKSMIKKINHRVILMDF
jgi:hypothetical protein